MAKILLKTFLIRILIILYCIIGGPMWLITVLFWWIIVLCSIVVLFPISWIFFGKIGVNFIAKLVELNTYRPYLGIKKDHEIEVTPIWFFEILEILLKWYKNAKSGCDCLK